RKLVDIAIAVDALEHLLGSAQALGEVTTGVDDDANRDETNRDGEVDAAAELGIAILAQTRRASVEEYRWLEPVSGIERHAHGRSGEDAVEQSIAIHVLQRGSRFVTALVERRAPGEAVEVGVEPDVHARAGAVAVVERCRITPLLGRSERVTEVQ